MKPGLTPSAAASAVLGLAAWLLASWGENAAFNVFPLQALTAALAVVLAIWAWRIPATAGDGRLLTRWLAGGGLVLGVVWLLSIGLLYLIWPR
ncbi:MAG: hypothetical protein ACYC5Y_04395 [Symbiobacteriia bacterium]